MYKKNTLFHIEDSAPDPETLKLRFRRRILTLAIVGFVFVLSIPVYHGMRPKLSARSDMRRLLEKIQETRLVSARARAPFSLQPQQKGWRRSYHHDGLCQDELSGPPEEWSTESIWSFSVRRENGELVPGKVLCLHPTNGLLVDGQPLDNQLLVLSATPFAEDGSPITSSRVRLLFGAYGSAQEYVDN